LIMRVKSFGFEIEFPIIQFGVFESWHPKLDSLRVPGRLYRDATPCAEYATAVNTDYNELMNECFEVFRKVKDAVVGSSSTSCILFIGRLPRVASPCSGHIHVGKPKGLRAKESTQLLRCLHGSQTLMELLAQNAKSGAHADGRARDSRGYYQFYHLQEDYPLNRFFHAYTWNEHKTVENRIPPSTDFYHLLTLLAVETAWINHYNGKTTFDLKENYHQATEFGADGKYWVFLGSEAVLVPYSAYVALHLKRIEKELKAELKKMETKNRKRVEHYLEFLKYTTMSEFLSKKTIGTLKNLTNRLLSDEKSYIDDVKIESPKVPVKKVSMNDILEIIEKGKNSKEYQEIQRTKAFIEAIKTGKLSRIKDPSDLKVAKKILGDRQIEEVI